CADYTGPAAADAVASCRERGRFCRDAFERAFNLISLEVGSALDREFFSRSRLGCPFRTWKFCPKWDRSIRKHRLAPPRGARSASGRCAVLVSVGTML